MSRFNDQSHIERWERAGILPKIHETLAGMILESADPDHEIAIDFGASVGLMSVRLSLMGLKHVISIEPGEDFERRIIHTCVSAYRTAVNDSTLSEIEAIIKKHHVTLAVCRRVIYLIEETADGCAGRFAAMLARAGITEIAIQGCVPVKNPKVKLWDTDLEVEAMHGHFITVDYKRDCVLMRRVR